MPVMNVKTLFQNLVRNQYMPDFDYFNHSFSFQTLFYLSTLEYQLCSCGFDHEHLTYVSDKGEINEDMLSRILQCIIDGKCPHVDAAPENHVCETKILGIHVAAAVGTVTAAKGYIASRDSQGMEPTGLFSVHPCVIAVIKNKPNMLGVLMDTYNPLPEVHKHFLRFGRVDKNMQAIDADEIVLLHFCVRQNNPLTLKRFLQTWTEPYWLTQALSFAFKNELPFMENILLDYIRSLVFQGLNGYIKDCAEEAIVFNKPHRLHQILQWAPTKVSKNGIQLLVGSSHRLKRKDCIDVLMHYFDSHFNKSESLEQTVEGINWLIRRLRRSFEELHADIKPILKAFSDSGLLHRSGYSNIGYFRFYLSKNELRTLQTLFELGADVNAFENSDFSLVKLLSQQEAYYPRFYPQFRVMIELLLSQNPDMKHQRSICSVDLILQTDLVLKQTWRYERCNPGDYVMDAQVHTFSGHDNDAEYALNFMGPLLKECGFPLKNEEIAKALDKPLHPSEMEYFRLCLEIPRSLKKSCRDVLRQHFTGRKIHSYVDAVNIPKSVRNYILLKDILLHES